jgi:hypothetical protein
MFAGHEHAARRRADVVAGVVGGESLPGGGEAIDVRRAELLLAVAAQVAVAEVVGDDEDDIRWIFGAGFGDAKDQQSDPNDRENGSHRASSPSPTLHY